MRVEYTVGVWDMVRFNLVHQFLSPVMNGLFLLLAALVFVGGLGPEGSRVEALAVALLWYLGLWTLQAILLALIFCTRRPDSVLTNHVIEIRDAGLFESTRFNESLFFWPGLLKIVRRPGFVAIFIAEHQAHVIPSRAFESNDAMDRFVKDLKRRCAAAGQATVR